MMFSNQMGGGQPHQQQSQLPEWYNNLVQSRALYNQGTTNPNGQPINKLQGQQMYDNVSQDQLRSLVGQRIGTFDGNTLNSDLFGTVNTFDVPQSFVNHGYAEAGEQDSGLRANPYIRRINVQNASGQNGPNDISQIDIDTRTGEVVNVSERSSKEQNRSRNQAALTMLGAAGAGYYSAANAAASGGAAAGGAASSGSGTSGAAGMAGARQMGTPVNQASNLGGTVTTSTGTTASGYNALGSAGAAAGGGGASGGAAGAANGAAPSGTLGQIGSYLANNSGTIGGIAGAVGSYLDARNQPDTLTSSTSRTLTPEMQRHADAYMNRVANQSATNPYLSGGASMINKAASDQSLMNTAIQTNRQFMENGGRNAYAGSNPYLEGAINRGMSDITRQGQNLVQSNDAVFARGNAFGGSAWRQAQAEAARQTGDAASNFQNNMRMQDYTTQQQLDENRLGRQQNAYMAAPGLDNARYTAGQQVMQAGQQQFNNQQTVNNAYGNGVSSIGGLTGTQTSTQNNPYQQNPWAAAIGGGLAGYQIGNYMNQGGR